MSPLIETAQTRRQMLAGTAAAAAAGLVALTEGCVREPVALAQVPEPEPQSPVAAPPELKLYQIESSGQMDEFSWWSAESPEAAARMVAELIHGSVLGPGLRNWPSDRSAVSWDFRLVWRDRRSELVTVTEVPPEETLKVRDEADEVTRTKTAREWAATGPGFVSCSC